VSPTFLVTSVDARGGGIFDNRLLYCARGERAQWVSLPSLLFGFFFLFFLGFLAGNHV